MFLLVLFRQVGEADPAFAILYPAELLSNFFLRVTRAFYHLPKCEELYKFDRPILVNVHLIEKFSRRDSAEARFPVIYCFSHLDWVAAVQVKYVKYRLDLLGEFGAQFLNAKQLIFRIQSAKLECVSEDRSFTDLHLCFHWLP